MKGFFKHIAIGKVIWTLLAGVLLVLAVSAVSSSKTLLCTGAVVSIGNINADSIQLAVVHKVLRQTLDKDLTAFPVENFPLEDLEQSLEQQLWIDNAHLYFDNAQILHVALNSKHPVARVFTTTGKGYFINEDGDVFASRNFNQFSLPVFVGLAPNILSDTGVAAASLKARIVEVAEAIVADSFWMAQADQVEIKGSDMALYPAIGNHTVLLGNGDNAADKLERVKVFYKEVLSDIGMNAYPIINASFVGQIVVQQSDNIKIENKQAVSENFEKMVKRNRTETAASAIENKDKGGRLLDTKQPVSSKAKKPPAAKASKAPAKTEATPQPKKTPKAIMPKFNNNN